MIEYGFWHGFFKFYEIIGKTFQHIDAMIDILGFLVGGFLFIIFVTLLIVGIGYAILKISNKLAGES